MKIRRIAAWVVDKDGFGYLSELLFRSESDMHRIMDRSIGHKKAIPIPVELEVPDDQEVRRVEASTENTEEVCDGK